MHLIHLLFVITINWPQLIAADRLPTCRAEDFKYSFTECDEIGGRWRVSIPTSPSQCIGGAPNAPIRVDKCFMSCDSGHFFNTTSLLCEHCLPGSYSLGGGIRIEGFNRSALPTGFHINTETIHTPGSCSGWRVVNNYIESIANNSGEGCVSKITYTVRVVKKGKLSFKYQYSTSDDLMNAIIFTFQYQNYDENGDQDSIGLDSGNNFKFPSITNEQQKWKEMQINLLRPGLYVFVWRSVLIGRSKSLIQTVDNSRSSYLFDSRTGSHSNSGFIRIKSLFVDGVAFASECTPCEPGSYSDTPGTEECTPCPSNFVSSTPGAQKCTSCDLSTQYSPMGSEVCSKKPICGKNDFYSIESDCNLQKQIQTISYKWIEPQICRDSNKVLPNTKYIPCNETTITSKRSDSCNLGMELRDDQKCHFCADNQFRDHTTQKCQSCPPSTAPQYALSYKVWHSNKTNDNSLPDFMSKKCYRILDEMEYECEPETAWQSNPYTSHYIRTGPSSLLGSYLFLTLTVPGFRQLNGGEITFKFEIECEPEDYCLFIFMERKRNAKLSEQTAIVQNWSQSSNGIQSFRHRIEQNISIAFDWIFQRNTSFQSNAKIYEITLTNPLVGSAIACNPCPHSTTGNCIPCPVGQYFETIESNTSKVDKELEALRSRGRMNAKCKQCPKNSIIDTNIAFPIGVQNSCIKCGPSLRDYEGISCYSECLITIDGDSFDLNQLNQPLLYRGGHLFTGGGTGFYHLFNITLCGPPDSKAICINNITKNDSNDYFLEEYNIESMVCRSTIIPDREQTMSTQSVSLGDQLVGITRNTTYQNITVHPEFQSVNSDLHFYYTTNAPTAACPLGRRMTLTVRCAPELEQNAVISAPKDCPDGTCDGCNFHFLVRTKTAAACRLCRSSDYETVVGECINGLQQIHLVNPKACIISSDGETKVQTRHCSVIPRQVQIGIALVSAVGVLLLMLVFHFWKKNRSLEYKYCKLIEGNEKSVECCAEDEDDDDNDDQVMVHPKKQKEVYDGGYETIQLTKHNDRNTDII